MSRVSAGTSPKVAGRIGEFDSEKSELAVAAMELEKIRRITAGNHVGLAECYLPCEAKSIATVRAVRRKP